ncbi:metal-dependent hydrolase [Piscinibacter terrae]|uniref:Metal-dependent hydrolase n=1 Tax=Piscinibacter terrae TaxID=2496871 RepID=A0A3N7K0A9_9BURK|nr:metal-dependent hydrolase [Albitalea terrae]RQP24455.1 metal-dependent hydrolase [Albitalea terrae]
MPTILTHAVVPLAIGLGLGSRAVPPHLLMAGIVASIAPDFDVLAFRLHVAYADTFGHRGATHSVGFAFLLATTAALLAGRLRTSPWKAFAFVGLCALSHPLLDMFTNGTHGVALWWPWSDERLVMPWHRIEASPIAFDRIASARTWVVLQSEMMWIWLPALAGFLALKLWSRGVTRSSRHAQT